MKPAAASKPTVDQVYSCRLEEFVVEMLTLCVGAKLTGKWGEVSFACQFQDQQGYTFRSTEAVSWWRMHKILKIRKKPKRLTGARSRCLRILFVCAVADVAWNRRVEWKCTIWKWPTKMTENCTTWNCKTWNGRRQEPWLSQGNRAMPRVFVHTKWLFDCYLQSTLNSRSLVVPYRITTMHTRKPCCRKETARCRKCSFLLKFANNIHYK